MRTFSLFFLLSIEFSQVVGQHFSKQVFVVYSYLNTESCEVTPECDCCSADLYFLNNDEFAYISKCITGDNFYKGEYSVANGSLTLNFFSKRVTEKYPNDDIEMAATYRIENAGLSSMVFKIEKCGKGIILRTRFQDEDFFGTHLNGVTFSLENLRKMKGYLKLTEL